MPPKSAKKEKPGWWRCEKCKLLILTAELTQHQTDDCSKLESLSGYLTEHGEFFSGQLERRNLNTFDDLKEISEHHLNGIVLISKTILGRLGLVLGDLAEVSISSGEKRFVRKVWPLEEKFGAKIFISRTDDIALEEQNDIIVCIKAFTHAVLNVEIMELKLCDQLCNQQSATNMHVWSKLLRKQYMGHVLNDQNELRMNLCNKRLTFEIANIRFKDDQNNFEDQLCKLALNGRFYQFDRDSKIIIITPQQPVILTKLHKSELSVDDIGGLGSVIDELKEIIQIALRLTAAPPGISICRGVLLHGVSGVGKTTLVNALVKHFGCLAIRINCSEIFSKFYGESENNISKLFNKALNNYPNPTIIILEELHNICPKAEGSEIVKRISHSIVNLLDNLNNSIKGDRTVVIGTTDNLENLNPSIRRSGRMDYEFEIPVPNESAREHILLKLLSAHKHALEPEEIRSIARVTHGYVGADLVSLVGRAEHESKSLVHYAHMVTALRHVKASAMREIMIECPNVRWSDIGGQQDLKLKLRQIIEWPIHKPEIFTRLGISPPRGLLMFGPPGCSKTLIAKAIATESRVNFLSIKGSELFSMWVGESERAVRELFRKARQVAPSIIFFDEIDAIGGERSADSGSSVKERVLAQILTEIDGVNTLKNVKIVAATNRPDMIDKALMRPGRLDRIIYVRLPDAATRNDIFQIKLAKIPLAPDVRHDDLVKRTEGYSGSEIEAICQEAVMRALEESFDTVEISQRYFDYALTAVKPRTSPELLQLYENYLKQHHQ